MADRMVPGGVGRVNREKGPLALVAKSQKGEAVVKVGMLENGKKAEFLADLLPRNAG